MADSSISYNVAAFFSALFVLEYGADKFVKYTAIVARQTGIPDTVIALLTAGAEWEELAVVISALAHRRSSLAVSTVVGSGISNILGAFSLGLLFRGTDQASSYDWSSRIYSLILLVVTTVAALALYFSNGTVRLVSGAVLVGIFASYLVSIGWAISRGSITAPEDSDSDDESDNGSDDDLEQGGDDSDQGRDEGVPGSNETDALLPVGDSNNTRRIRRQRPSLLSQVFHLIVGFLAICLAGYILSAAAMNITDALGMSDVLFGVVILAIATTLPEKFIAVLSGSRGQVGIIVANTAGSNVFLLSLCLGITMMDTSRGFDDENVNIVELSVLWFSTLAFTLTVWLGGRFDRWIGASMLTAYVGFLVAEFTAIRGVSDGPSSQ